MNHTFAVDSDAMKELYIHATTLFDHEAWLPNPNTWDATRFFISEILLAILKNIIWSLKMCLKSSIAKESSRKTIPMSSVHADGLVLLGARSSAGSVMIEFGSYILYIYILGLTIKGTSLNFCMQFLSVMTTRHVKQWPRTTAICALLK